MVKYNESGSVARHYCESKHVTIKDCTSNKFGKRNESRKINILDEYPKLQVKLFKNKDPRTNQEENFKIFINLNTRDEQSHRLSELTINDASSDPRGKRNIKEPNSSSDESVRSSDLTSPQVYGVYNTMSSLRTELLKKCQHEYGDKEQCICEACENFNVVNDSLKHPMACDFVPFKTKKNRRRKRLHKDSSADSSEGTPRSSCTQTNDKNQTEIADLKRRVREIEERLSKIEGAKDRSMQIGKIQTDDINLTQSNRCLELVNLELNNEDSTKVYLMGNKSNIKLIHKALNRYMMNKYKAKVFDNLEKPNNHQETRQLFCNSEYTESSKYLNASPSDRTTASSRTVSRSLFSAIQRKFNSDPKQEVVCWQSWKEFLNLFKKPSTSAKPTANPRFRGGDGHPQELDALQHE